MAQQYYRANLTDSQFPFVSSFQGKTVIQGGLDQHYIPTTSLSGDTKDKGIPDCSYMHNVLPTQQGYKSVDYADAVPAVASNEVFKRIFPVKDFDGNRGLVATTYTGKTYLIVGGMFAWLDITPAGQPTIIDVTIANVTGSSFICYANWGIYIVDLIHKQLTPANIQWDAPLTNASITGIGNSNNYLLAHDGTTLYWSSALDVLDFKQSQITGANSGVPTDSQGNLLLINYVSVGFAVYCQGNIVVATYSGNTQFPWLFKAATNSAGLSDITAVCQGEDNSNYAYTAAGLLKVSLSGCVPVFPEATDFLGARVFEDYDVTTDTLNLSYPKVNVVVKLAFIASRLLVISYGEGETTFALVYDTGLKRWGKLKMLHSQVFEADYNMLNSSYSTYYDLGLYPYSYYADTTYLTMIPNKNSAPPAKHSLGLLQLDGTVKLLVIDYGNFNSDAVIILGKYQITRNSTLSIQSISIESIDIEDTDFELDILTSDDGKNTSLVTTPEPVSTSNLKTYEPRVTGANHSLRIKGAFHLVGVVLVFTKHGSR